jgi:hypothetical protein
MAADAEGVVLRGLLFLIALIGLTLLFKHLLAGLLPAVSLILVLAFLCRILD